MRQFEFEYTSDIELTQSLKKMSLWCKSNIVSDIVFHNPLDMHT